MIGGTEVGAVFTRLGFRVEDAPANAYERKVEKLHTEARRDVVTHAKVDADLSGATRYERKVREIDGAHNDLVRGSGRLRTGLGSIFVGGAGVAAGAVGFGLLAKGAWDAVGAFDASNKVAMQTAAVIKSTGGAANVTAADIDKLSTSISRKTGIDDEMVASGANMLLTFTNVRNEAGKGNDIFTQGTKILADMSAALGTDMPTSAIQLGKALNDPIKGVTALQRVGVSFTEKQKDTIKSLVETGHTADAQKLILKELGKEFGGSAAAQATAADKLKTSLGNLQEWVGGKLSPTFNAAAGWLSHFTDQMTDGTGQGGRFLDRTKQIASLVGGVLVGAFRVGGKAIDYVTDLIHDNRSQLDGMGRTIGGLARSVFNAFGSILRAARSTFGEGSGTSRDIHNIVTQLLVIIGAAEKVYAAVAKRALPGIVTAFRGAFQVIRGIIRLISGVLSGDFGKAWAGVKDIFTGAIKGTLGQLRAMTAPARAAAAAVGRAIGSAFSSAWGSIVGTATGFVNKIIDVINIIPGVNIGHVGGGGSSSRYTGSGNPAGNNPGGGDSDNDGQGGRQTSAQFLDPSTVGMYREGGRVDRPIAIMGEEAPQHSEWVIPENPAYRGRAVALWSMAGKALGVPGFFGGGVFGGAGKVVGKAAGIVGDVVGTVTHAAGSVASAAASIPGKVLDTAGHLASYLTGKLPKPPGGVISGAYSYAVDKAKDFIGSKASGALDAFKNALGLNEDNGAGTGGLVAQVKRAIAWARAHGWHGSIISGARDRAGQRTAAIGYARRTGQTLAQAYPNGIYASNHLGGQAIDVTDRDAFARAMASAPANARLLSLIPKDPAHFSVSGHRRGGILGTIGGLLGGELLAGGTRAFRTGGRIAGVGPVGHTAGAKKKPHALAKKESSAITRSVQRGERGIAGYETKIQRLEREYGQADTRFDLTDEQFLIEHDDGSITVDDAAVQKRAGEIDALAKRRREIRATIEAYRKKITAAIAALRKAIAQMKRALAAATGKKLQKDRASYRERISNYSQRANELQGTYGDLGLDVTDNTLDLAELAKERREVTGSKGQDADAEKPDSPSTYTDAEQTEIDRLDAGIATAKLTPGDDDDKAAAAAKAAFLKPILDAAQANGGAGRGGFSAITQIAGDLGGVLPQDDTSSGSSADGTSSDGPSIAEQVLAELSAFQSSRADLFSAFGSNVEAGNASLAALFGGDPSRAAAGLRHFGAFGSPDDGRPPVQITNHFAAPPPDPHTWAQQQRYEVEGAIA